MYELPIIEATISSVKKMLETTYDPAHPEYSAEWRDMLTQLENLKREQEALEAIPPIPHTWDANSFSTPIPTPPSP